MRPRALPPGVSDLGNFVYGLEFGAGFTIVFAIGLTYAVLALLAHPTLRKFATALDRIARKLEGSGGGILDQVMGFLGIGGKKE